MKERITIEHSGETIHIDSSENCRTFINVSTCGPALGGGAFVYASTVNDDTKNRTVWHNKRMMLGDMCVISIGEQKEPREVIMEEDSATDLKDALEGFRVMVNDRTFRIGLPDSAVGVLITDKEGPCTVCLSGYTSDNVACTWFKKPVEVGDVYIIDYLPLSSVDEPVSKIQF
ncbi:MAG: hypothetical protein IKY95_03275 [Bacteroidales bacterium]|nr:hypothetical protein [Bacteroidales bacterium]